MTLSARRAAVNGVEEGEGYSERRACVVVGLSRSSCRYRPREEAGEEKKGASQRDGQQGGA